MRDRRAGLRTAGLDPDARPHRDRPPLGTGTAPAAPVRHRRTPSPRRPRTPVAARPTIAMGQRVHRRDRPPAGSSVGLTRRNSPPTRKENPRPVEPRAPGATAGQPGTTRRRKTAPRAQCLRPPPHGRERSRLLRAYHGPNACENQFRYFLTIHEHFPALEG